MYHEINSLIRRVHDSLFFRCRESFIITIYIVNHFFITIIDRFSMFIRSTNVYHVSE